MGLTAGTTTISYTSTNNATNSIMVTVYPVANSVNPTYAQVLQIGETTTVSVGAGLSSLATDKAFSSTNPLITVPGSDGTLTAIGAGTSVINYVGRDAAGVVIEKGTTSVTAYPAAIIENPVYKGNGSNGLFQAGDFYIYPTNPIRPSNGQSITWSSSDSSSFLVREPDGDVSRRKMGTSIISYKIIETSTGRIVKKGSTTVAGDW